MKSFYTLIAFLGLLFTALPSCEQWAEEPIAEVEFLQKKDEPMPATPVTAADYGGSLPLASLMAPNDGDDVVANDIRPAEAAILAALKAVGTPFEYVYTNVPTTPFVVGPPNTFSGNTWTDSIITLDVPNCRIGDTIDVQAWGNWQLNASSSPGDVVGRARIEIIEDVGGAPLVVPNIYGLATITDDGAALTLPHNEPYLLRIKHVVTTNGTSRITVQIRSEDLTGGAGTGTLILTFSARMDATHWKRTQ